jgi:hypothetical protein
MNLSICLFYRPENQLYRDQVEIFLFNLVVMDYKRDAVVGGLRSILVPTISDWQTVTLPNPLYPLY